MENSPKLWKSALPVKNTNQHKYCHGLAVVFGAPALTGATRLVAEAAARVGVGLVEVVADAGTAPIYRASLPPHILVREGAASPKQSAVLYGSGGLSARPNFCAQVPVVLDADALYELPAELPPHYVLTPHEGEFARAFPKLKGSREDKATEAAKTIGAHIVLKGASTIIAAPDGNIITNQHASPHLATAGSGDALAGMILGLLAQGMDVFLASAAAVWIHGDISINIGRGLVASDIPAQIPASLKKIFGE